MSETPLARPRSPAMPNSAWQRSLTAYGVAAVLLLSVGQDVVRSMIGTWTHTTTYHHGFIVLPICLLLIWRQRRRLALAEPTGSALGALCLLPFGALWVLGAAGDVMFFQQLGLVGLLVALVPSLMGWQVTRIVWFSLLFAFAMVPFGDELVPALQDITADFSVWMLRLVGVPVFREGVLIQTPSGFFEVAEACAGLRFLIANLVVAFLFCHFTYRVWWKWAAFMVLATLIPILANGLRAFGIIFVAYQTDNEVAAGVDHIVYGWGFFTIVMLVSLFIGNLFADRGMAGLGAVEPEDGERPKGEGRRLALGFAALAIAVALAGPVWGLLMSRAAAPEERTLPRLADTGWPAAESAGDWGAAFPAADAVQSASYLVDGVPLDVFLAYYRYQRQGAELVHGANSLFGDRWIRVRTTGWSATVAGREVPGRVLQLARGSERRLVAAFYWIDGEFVSDDLEVKLHQALARLGLREAPAGALVLSTPFEGDVEEGLARVRRFLERAGAFAPALPVDGS